MTRSKKFQASACHQLPSPK